MNLRLSLHVVGTFIKFFGLIMLLPMACSLIYGDGAFHVFLISGFIVSIAGQLLESSTKQSEWSRELSRKDTFLIALLCWLLASLLGALPYLLAPHFPNAIDAIFESFSGYTTTGATILSDIEALPPSILFYRSLTQWLGGMGIIILAIAILPKLSVGGMQLMKLETTGPTTEKLTPQIASTAKKLWMIYVGLSFASFVLYFLCGMPAFDAINTAFCTVSTAGYSIKNASIGAYNSPLIECVAILFMFLGGINFLLHYAVFTGRLKRVWENTEIRFFVVLLVLYIFGVSIDLWYEQYPHYPDALRYAAFQVVSIFTTTGFSSADSAAWGGFAIFALFTLMFMGACAGSTCGSIKLIRVLVLLKKGIREVNQLIKPHAVLTIRLDNRAVSENIITSVTSFFLLYLFIMLLSVLVILLADNISVLGALSASAATIGNVGPGFAEVGVTGNYQFLSPFTKLWMCMLMILGRLELYTVLVFFSPLFWRK